MSIPAHFCFEKAQHFKAVLEETHRLKTKTLRYEFNLHYNLNLLLTNYWRFGRQAELATAPVKYHTDQSRSTALAHTNW